jgi:hypothetical protein
MAYIEELPQVHFGKLGKPIDWRKDNDEETDEDAPASEELIAMLGFDPDEDKETADESAVISLVKEEIAAIRAKIAERKVEQNQVPVAEAAPAGVAVNPSNSGGIVFKGYTIRQTMEGEFELFSIGGSKIGHSPTLELAMNRINEIAIKGSE